MDLFRVKPDDNFKSLVGTTITGTVTHVIDGDTFKLYHTPLGSLGRLAGWGILWNVPTNVAEQRKTTFSIRLAGVDAPELAKQGKPGQPFADEAKQFLTELIGKKTVRVHIHSVDQYNRPVATVTLSRHGSGRSPVGRTDVGYELVANSLAYVYRRGGAQYGGNKDLYFKTEEDAKERREKIWKNPKAETPGEYKARHRNDAS